MDGHNREHRMLAAFLAGDLDPAGASGWDEHLLACEQCWRAVREDRAGRQAAQLLRQAAPPGLADRVAFTVEVAAAGHPAGQRQAAAGTRARRRARPGRPGWRRLAARTLAAGLAVTLVVALLPGGRETGSVPAAVAAVARYAQAIPPPGRQLEPGQRAVPMQVGRPVTVTADGQRIVVATWRLGGAEAVVAVSGRPFPMPPGGEEAAGGGMAWSARLGKLGLYCLNGRTSELVAAPVPEAELAALAARLSRA